MKITIKLLKKIVKERSLSHIIVFARDENGKQTHVATYGKTLEQCSQAADFGNKLKSSLGWPKSLQAQPSRVKELCKRIEVLKKEIEELKNN